MTKPNKRLSQRRQSTLLNTNNSAASDNTRVSRPILPVNRKINPGETVIYKYKKGLRFPTGIVKSKQEVVSQDNRSSYQKRQDDIALQNVKRRIHEQQNYQNAAEGVSAIGKLISPSTYVGAAARSLTGDGTFGDNLVGGTGFNNPMANIVFDAASPMVIGKGVRGISNASKWVQKSYKPFIVSRYMNRSYKPNGLNVVNDAFRNSEWSNFLATKNGNYYYRLQREPGLVSTNVRKDNGGYFMSHTTPWEEFSGLGTPSPIGSKVLYEFPHDTFGDLLASTSKGHYTSNDVAELGRLHLLYGNTSSGKRGLVRVTSDENAKLLDMSPFKYGIVDRPKTSNRFYDNNPIYEDVDIGNQTVVSPQVLNNALQNTSYNMYQYSPQGIIKSIYSPSS